MDSNNSLRIRRYAGILLGILCLSAGQCPIIGLTGQNPDIEELPRAFSSGIIRVSANLVTLPVSVTDSSGNAVYGLDGDDFLIEEDGRPETIFRVAEAGQSPLQLTLLFDLSGSLNPRFHFEQQAAKTFLEKVWKPGDSISVVAFSDRPSICLNGSYSLGDAVKVLSRLQPTEGPTAFFDSVVLSARMLRKTAGPETRRSLVALSDGEDNRSEYSLSAVIQEIQHSDTIFYSINPAGTSIRLNEISLQGQADLESLAKETGGTAFLSDKPEELEDVFRRIVADLRAQYLLSYYSTNMRVDGRYRQIAVSIPQRPELRIRARRGYFAGIRPEPGAPEILKNQE